MTLRLLIDTCVWLDLAKDYRNLPLLEILDELVQRGDVELIVPQLLLDEYWRSKERVLKQATASQKEHFKLVRAAITNFGEGDTAPALSKLEDVQNRIFVNGELTAITVEKVEKLLTNTPVVEISLFAKARAAERSLYRQAPFHAKKDSMGDAILIETYAILVEEAFKDGTTFAFVTTNTTDFSQPGGHSSVPHQDFGGIFNDRSNFYVSLKSALEPVDIDLFNDSEIEDMFFSDQTRTVSEMREARELLWHQVWYNRHRYLKARIEAGDVKIVSIEDYRKNPRNQQHITDTTWRTAQEAGACWMSPRTDPALSPRSDPPGRYACWFMMWSMLLSPSVSFSLSRSLL